VLLKQVVNDRVVLPVDPAGDEQKKKPSGRGSESMAKACRRSRATSSPGDRILGSQTRPETTIFQESSPGQIFAQDGNG